MRVAELLPNVLKYVTPGINEADMVDLLKNINKYTIVDKADIQVSALYVSETGLWYY